MTTVLSEVDEQWVTVERPRVGLSKPVLHRASCAAVKRANPDNVWAEFGGINRSEAWVYQNGHGFDSVCRRCCPNLA